MNQTSIYEVDANEFNQKLADALKQIAEFEVPEWSLYVKTSTAKQRPPFEDDFWYKRAASILRQLYRKETVGVGRLKTRYGGKKNKGAKPEKFAKGSGKIIRVILQQSEKAGLVEQSKGSRKGRKLTEKGTQLMNQIASELKK